MNFLNSSSGRSKKTCDSLAGDSEDSNLSDKPESSGGKVKRNTNNDDNDGTLLGQLGSLPENNVGRGEETSSSLPRVDELMGTGTDNISRGAKESHLRVIGLSEHDMANAPRNDAHDAFDNISRKCGDEHKYVQKKNENADLNSECLVENIKNLKISDPSQQITKKFTGYIKSLVKHYKTKSEFKVESSNDSPTSKCQNIITGNIKKRPAKFGHIINEVEDINKDVIIQEAFEQERYCLATAKPGQNMIIESEELCQPKPCTPYKNNKNSDGIVCKKTLKKVTFPEDQIVEKEHRIMGVTDYVNTTNKQYSIDDYIQNYMVDEETHDLDENDQEKMVDPRKKKGMHKQKKAKYGLPDDICNNIIPESSLLPQRRKKDSSQDSGACAVRGKLPSPVCCKNMPVNNIDNNKNLQINDPSVEIIDKSLVNKKLHYKTNSESSNNRPVSKCQKFTEDNSAGATKKKPAMFGYLIEEVENNKPTTKKRPAKFDHIFNKVENISKNVIIHEAIEQEKYCLAAPKPGPNIITDSEELCQPEPWTCYNNNKNSDGKVCKKTLKKDQLMEEEHKILGVTEYINTTDKQYSFHDYLQNYKVDETDNLDESHQEKMIDPLKKKGMHGQKKAVYGLPDIVCTNVIPEPSLLPLFWPDSSQDSGACAVTEKIPCPVCYVKFPINEIEAHAWYCQDYEDDGAYGGF
ncbi:hypothetical protein C0J52_15126 [Blattella germanica]|nr:hypothetical protein C0J52_15126 [Blattella germanica]